jgi:uncharacterized SAM-binding protein YcdF (DUF218 family)
MRDALIAFGVPADQILLESGSRTTAEQLAALARLLVERDVHGPVVLVASAAHIRRVMSVAAMNHLDAVPSVAGALRYGPREHGWRRWRPNLDALRVSESAMYEYIALAYYMVTGRSG